MATTKAEISAEASTRILTHMNADHAVTVHAMVTSNLSHRDSARCKVQNAKMTSVTTTGYSISYVSCDGDACARMEMRIPFDPPLTSPAQAKSRLVRDHHRALAPRFAWLVADPLTRAVFGGGAVLVAGAALGREELARRVDAVPWAAAVLAAAFGTSARFAGLVVGLGYFTLVAHGVEACYTAYLCKTSLKMETGSIFKWVVLNLCAGFPIMDKVKELVAVDSASRSEKKSR